MKTLVFILTFCVCSVSSAASLYNVGSTQLGVSFDKNYTTSWFYYSLKVGDKSYMNVNSSGNGTVIRYSPNQLFAGPIHGNTSLVSETLLRDGIPSPLTDGQNLVGNVFTLSKTELYNSSYRVSSTLTVVDKGFDQHITYDGYDASKTVDLFYGSLGTRADRLSNWAAYDYNGNLLGTGATTLENSSNTYLPANTMIVAQYDPIVGDGVVTRWSFQGSPYVFIVDRPYDNKLYLHMPGMVGAANKNLELTESVRVFYADSASWLKKAPLAVPEPSTWLLLIVGLALMRLFCGNQSN